MDWNAGRHSLTGYLHPAVQIDTLKATLWTASLRIHLLHRLLPNTEAWSFNTVAA